MIDIELSKNIPVPIDKVWEVVGDIDREPEFWPGTKSIRNISKEGNTVEREVVLVWKNSLTREIVKFEPKKRIYTEILKGPAKGTKTLTLTSLESNTTTLTVSWEVELSGFNKSFSGLVKKEMSKESEEALERISKKLTQSQ